ncbi:unnamed protein product [Caenorhabditis auriculariae]|uniref:BHLH domain-containing protein n=1 Tax=Caenorhabditis auriculariae TaxID=2777116 RepID=A0A8S1HFR0_9PELO|nr:unnamed protein product [Caenorhabditis auriculariae]
MSDPFLSLETNLDDISTVLGGDVMDYDMDTSANWSSAQSTSSSQPSYATQGHHVRRPNQHSPPQEFYDPNRPPEVGSMMSLLYNGPVDDPYASMKFSPPNLDIPSPTTMHNLTGPAGMLSQLGPAQMAQANGYPADGYRPMAGPQQMISGAQPVMSPPALYVLTQPHEMEQNGMERKPFLDQNAMMISPPQQSGAMHRIKSEPNTSYPSPSHMQQQGYQIHQMMPPQQQNGDVTYAQQAQSPEPRNTKEELLRMLANMSPDEVEQLKGRKSQQSQPQQPPPQAMMQQQVPPPPLAMETTPPPPPTSSYTPRSTRVQPQTWIDDEEDTDDGDTMSSAPERTSRPPKTERRTAHNLIEKKYRCSINDRIQHLKSLLAGDDAKLSKSATLRKAIEHIESIEAENNALKADNDRLRQILLNNGFECPPSVGSDSSRVEMQQVSPSQLPSQLPQPPPPAANVKRGTKRARANTNVAAAATPEAVATPSSPDGSQARVTIFAFMLAVLVFNPLSFLVQGSHVAAIRDHQASPFDHGRILDDSPALSQSEDQWWHHNVIRPLFVWSINFFVVFCVLARLLVWGEPVQDFKSGSWSSFGSTREKARQEAEDGNLREAQRQFCECLVILDRPLPSAGVDAFLSVVWQLIRHLLNWLWIGRWLARRRRSTTTTVSAVCRSHAHTAVLYHDIHQLHLMGIDNDNGEPTSGLYLALSAVNLAESAGASADGLPRAVMAQIYIAAALRCRISLPPFIASVTSGYFFRRARRHVRRAPEHSVSHLLWLFHPAARKYMANAQRLREVLSTRQNMKLEPFVDEDPGMPLSRLRGALKVHLLAQLVNELAGGEDVDVRPSSEVATSTATSTDDVDVVDISRLLVSMCTQTSVPSNGKDEAAKFGSWLPRSGDAPCTWWAHVLTCAVYWRTGKTEAARKHYSLIRNCPQALLQDRLALSVGHALCARKLCVDDRDSSLFGKYVCIHSRKSLETLRLFSAPNSPPIVRVVQDGVRRMAYEWVMSCLLDAWRASLDAAQPYWTQKFDLQPTFSTLYQESCNHYTIIHGRCGGSRLLVYELTSRMLNGANPQTTWIGVRRVRAARLAAVRGRVSMRRAAQPDAFHLHTLCKLHASMDLT